MEKEIIRYAYISRSKKITDCVLYESWFTYSVKSDPDQMVTHKAPYSDISKIHLSKPDIGWYGMDIWLVNGQRLHFKNFSFYKEENNAIVRIKPTPDNNLYSAAVANTYREFVLTLHKQVRINQVSEKIKFTYGSTLIKLFILFAILITGAVILPMALKLASIGSILFLITAALLLLLFYFKIGFKKGYQVDEVPGNYLPVAQQIIA